MPISWYIILVHIFISNGKCPLLKLLCTLRRFCEKPPLHSLGLNIFGSTLSHISLKFSISNFYWSVWQGERQRTYHSDPLLKLPTPVTPPPLPPTTSTQQCKLHSIPHQYVLSCDDGGSLHLPSQTSPEAAPWKLWWWEGSNSWPPPPSWPSPERASYHPPISTFTPSQS